MGSWIRGTLAGVFALSGTGCFEPSEEAKARVVLMQVEAEGMTRALDSVEERLLGNQAMIHLWQELARRHKNVSALACNVAVSHTTGLLAHHEHQAEKASRLRRRNSGLSRAVFKTDANTVQNDVASASGVAPDALLPSSEDRKL